MNDMGSILHALYTTFNNRCVEFVYYWIKNKKSVTFYARM